MRALSWAAAELLALFMAAAVMSQGCNRVSCDELHDPACWIPPAEAGSDADGALEGAPVDVEADAAAAPAEVDADAAAAPAEVDADAGQD
jgi:hypothetical protein